MIASSRRAQIKDRLEFSRGKRHLDDYVKVYVDDVDELMTELEQTEAELDDMTRDRNSYRASYNAERALRKREREGGRGWFGRWLGL